MRSVMHSPVLVLNASYEPLHICAARRALTLVVKDAAHIQEHAGREVHAGIMFPTVIRLKAYRKVPHRVQVLTRRNILVRDGHQCQYCGETFSAMELTLDHVIPRSRGGLSTWENLVACCSADNRRKADRTPEEAGMPLLRRPRPVTLHTARGILRSHADADRVWQKAAPPALQALMAMHRACTPDNSVRLTGSAPTTSWRDWPRGLGACLWHTIQKFNSPIPSQPFGPLAHSGEHSVCTREAVGAKPTGSTMYCCLRRSGDYAGPKNQRTQFDSARQHQDVGG